MSPEPSPSSPAPASLPPTDGLRGGAGQAPWGVLAVGLALGLVIGMFVLDRVRPAASQLPLPTPAPASVPDAGLTPAQAERLISALEGFDAAARRLSEAVNRAGSNDVPAPASAPTPSPVASPVADGERLIAWLPAEGVPLGKVWYGRRIRAELAELELLASNPSASLGPDPASERLANAQAEWKRQGERLLGELESLAAVQTELDFARWLDETGRGDAPPKAWQLRALSDELRTTGR